MNTRDHARFETFRKVRDFGQEHLSGLPAGSPADLALRDLDGALRAAEEDDATSLVNAREGTIQKRQARRALTIHLDAIARTAKVIGETTPGFEERFTLPRPRTERIVRTAAQAFVQEAGPVSAQLIGAGLPADFLATLTAAYETYQRSATARRVGGLARASAHAGIRKAADAGMKAMRAIDVVVRYQFAHDPAVLAAWMQAKRIGGRRAKKAQPTAETPPASASAATSPPVTAAVKSGAAASRGEPPVDPPVAASTDAIDPAA